MAMAVRARERAGRNSDGRRLWWHRGEPKSDGKRKGRKGRCAVTKKSWRQRHDGVQGTTCMASVT
ncbi:hypothetical protein E2562_035788 [Oryza meyeriana var. granulata]|uniref:Uncharacterized protein n=1 Tax=Oryza meyeriana var. granulata TaxID=110450 RepID=A0A6G1CLD6_9ORYZ|nr:hypothetical protein E2562_035788 [Oryza meyeriana var. granulata]